MATHVPDKRAIYKDNQLEHLRLIGHYEPGSVDVIVCRLFKLQLCALSAVLELQCLCSETFGKNTNFKKHQVNRKGSGKWFHVTLHHTSLIWVQVLAETVAAAVLKRNSKALFFPTK